jgi:hypothetical protein
LGEEIEQLVKKEKSSCDAGPGVIGEKKGGGDTIERKAQQLFVEEPTAHGLPLCFQSLRLFLSQATHYGAGRIRTSSCILGNAADAISLLELITSNHS